MSASVQRLSNAALLTLAVAAPCIAFDSGDLFVAMPHGHIARYDKTLTRVQLLVTKTRGDTTGMAFDPRGNLLVTNFHAQTVTRLDAASGGVLGQNPFVTTDGNNESIVFDRSGNFYVGVSGDRRGAIFAFGSDGKSLDGYPIRVPAEIRGADWLDLARDQKTLFYTSEGPRILRFDLSTKTALPDFAILPGNARAFAMRLLPDGGLIVAALKDIERLNADGEVTKRYAIDGIDQWFALNLTPDGTAFWSGDQRTGTVAKFDIQSGRLLASFVTEPGIGGLAVCGESTVARPMPSAASSSTNSFVEDVMDATKLVAIYTLLAFLVERLTNGLATLLSYSHSWRARFEPLPELDAARQANVQRNRRVMLFCLSAVVAVIGAALVKLELLAAVGITTVPPIADRIVSGLAIAAGGDPIREFLDKRSTRSSERSERSGPTPIQVTGTLVLSQSAAAPNAQPAIEA